MRHCIILIAMLLSLTSAFGESHGRCGDNLTWTLSDDGALTVSGIGKMKDFGSGSAPWNPTLVREITIEEGVTTIGANAFSNSPIYSLTLPVTIVSIGKGAFSNCRNLTTAQLPYGLTEIGIEAFSNCKSLVKIDLPTSIKKIQKKAFAGCKMLNSLSLSSRIEVLGENAFEGCKSLKEFYSLPDIVTTDNCRQYGLDATAVISFYNAKRNQQTQMLAANQGVFSIFTPKSEQTQSKKSIRADVAYGQSDVDMSIPMKPSNNNHTFAFIFANENYQSFPDVPFAINDGKSFYKYCNMAMGIPAENITVRYNATLGAMLQTIDYIKQIDNSYQGNLNIIIYYAGHGAPDEKTSKPYLIPTDAYSLNEKVCYPLDQLYSELGKLQASSVKVLMDACFSGTGRTEDMLAGGGRAVRRVPKQNAVSGNVVVISATSSDQTAWHYKEHGHGLFTYCLLKKLQESGGDVSMGELCDYLETEVPKLSIVHNHVQQTPTSACSPNLGNGWRLWQLKK